ncbi:MAG: FkbM family methyltransferase [Rubricoccaceae bacterium]|nr:FkbM family methyltransferase [Rubricoccaceae bacterium]
MSPRELLHTAVWIKRHVLKQLSVPEASLLVDHVEPSDVLLDVGAHAGAWTAALSKLVPSGKVVAFEALPYYVRVLEATLRMIGKANVTVINKALLDERKVVEIVWRDRKGNRLTGLTHIRGEEEPAHETVEVNATTLDTLMNQFEGRVRFIKLDIEGAELLALRGAENLISAYRPILYLELRESFCKRYGYVPADVFTFLEEKDYAGYLHRDDGSWEHITAETYDDENDVWFVPIEEAETFTGSRDPAGSSVAR